MLGLNGNARWTILFVLLVSDIFSSLRHLAALGYNNLSVMLGRGYWLLLGQSIEKSLAKKILSPISERRRME